MEVLGGVEKGRVGGGEGILGGGLGLGLGLGEVEEWV